ncbi:MAG: histidine phosphatase family protein [Methyloligellaceae bacterium]
MTRIIIARHGNTFDAGEVVTRVGARTDIPLSNSGKVQAIALGQYFKEQSSPFDIAFCSTLRRTKETADIILSERQSEITPSVLTFLTEIDYGPDENLPEDIVLQRIGQDAIDKWEKLGTPPQGWLVEPDRLMQEWRDFFSLMHAENNGKNILVVTSNGIARFALQAIDSAASHSLKLKTGAFGEITIDNGGKARIMEWNIRP